MACKLIESCVPAMDKAKESLGVAVLCWLNKKISLYQPTLYQYKVDWYKLIFLFRPSTEHLFCIGTTVALIC